MYHLDEPGIAELVEGRADRRAGPVVFTYIQRKGTLTTHHYGQQRREGQQRGSR